MNETLLEDKNESKRVRYRVTRYVIIDNQLYKHGYSLHLLKCLTPEDGDNVLREIHEGICGNHFGGRALIYKAMR